MHATIAHTGYLRTNFQFLKRKTEVAEQLAWLAKLTTFRVVLQTNRESLLVRYNCLCLCPLLLELGCPLYAQLPHVVVLRKQRLLIDRAHLAQEVKCFDGLFSLALGCVTYFILRR
jgi:hypothetical protein